MCKTSLNFRIVSFRCWVFIGGLLILLAMMLAPAISVAQQLAPTDASEEFIASKIEDLAGIWETRFVGAVAYMQYEADGTSKLATSLENLNTGFNNMLGTVWFEGTVLYVKDAYGAGTYEVRVQKEVNSPAHLTFIEIDDPNADRARDLTAGMTWVAPSLQAAMGEESLPSSAQQAGEFQIHGELYAYDGEFGNPIAVERFSRSETHAKESEIVAGSQGNFGEASFVIDLAKGQLGTFVEASNGRAYTEGVFWAGVAEAHTSFEDTLTFTIPAGVYPSGVSARLRAKVNGRVLVNGSAPTLPVTAYQSYGLLLASPLQREDLSHQATEKTPASGEYKIEKYITLAVQLLESGRILEERTTVTAYFSGKMSGIARTTRSVEQTALADFYGSLKITELEVPEGVTWTSASGVFLRDVPIVEKKIPNTWERRDGKH